MNTKLKYKLSGAQYVHLACQGGWFTPYHTRQCWSPKSPENAL